MSDILVVLNQIETAQSELAAAALVAIRLTPARIDVLHVRAGTDPSFMPTEEVMTAERRARFEKEADAQSAALRAAFDLWSQKQARGLDAQWREVIGVESNVVAEQGDSVDLIVMSRPAHDELGDGTSTIEASLFEARAPIMLVADTVPETIGAHVAIAWKASDTAERAVAAALPLLRAAQTVTVLIGEESGGEIPPPNELLSAIGEQSRAPALHRFRLDGQSSGAALAAEARRIGADLLVMGAYAHRPFIELIIGGATRYVLAKADLPVLMRH